MILRLHHRMVLVGSALAMALCVLLVVLVVTVQSAQTPAPAANTKVTFTNDRDGSGGSSVEQDSIHRHVEVVERLGGGSLR